MASGRTIFHATWLMTLLAAGPAKAELVVLASTEPGITTGTTVPDGSSLEVVEGATVTLVAADGKITTLRGPVTTVVGGQAPVEDSLLDAVAVLLRDEERTVKLGAARGEGCSQVVGATAWAAIDALIVKGCLEEARERLVRFREHVVDPALYLGSLIPGYAPGQPIRLRLQSNFTAWLYCYTTRADGRTLVFYPRLAAAGATLYADREASLEELLYPDRLTAGPDAGGERIQCFATDSDVGASLPAILRRASNDPVPDELAANLAERFRDSSARKLVAAEVRLQVLQ